jgi:hypothetical protein
MVVPRASGVECLGTEPGRERASLGFRVFETLSVPTHVTLHSCFGVPLVCAGQRPEPPQMHPPHEAMSLPGDGEA